MSSLHKAELPHFPRGEKEKLPPKTYHRNFFPERFQGLIKPPIHPAYELIRKYELEKPPYLLDAIAASNNAFSSLLRATNQPYALIPSSRYHLLPENTFQEVTERNGEPSPQIVAARSDQRYRRAFISSLEQQDYPVEVVQSVLHETGHLHEFNSVEFVPNHSDNFIFHRIGWRVFETYKQGEQHRHSAAFFSGVGEAVMAYLEKKFLPVVLDATPTLRALRHKDPHKDARLKAFVARRENVPPDEISWTDDKGSACGFFSYFSQRKVLDYVTQCIYEDCSGVFESREAVMDALFVRPPFNGHILRTAKYMTESFGKGAFRTLGGMTVDPAYASHTLDNLRKQRINMRKSPFTPPS